MSAILLTFAALLSSVQPQGAVIRGRVLAGDTGTPIKRAVVTISSPGGVQRSVNTDDEGRFEFAGLPADSYRLGAIPGPTRGQYLSLRYGGRDPMDPGARIEVVEGQRVERADIVLPRSAVIVGRVSDDAGEALARVPVYAMQFRGGQPVRLSSLSDTTDDLGQFRLFGLMAGEYIIAADLRPSSSVVEGETQGFVTTYHPGTPSVSEAVRVRVKPGEEAPADIRLLRTRLFKISGSIVNRRGEPVQRAALSVVRRDFTTAVASNSAAVDQSGRFTVANLPPGDYRLLVRDRSPMNEAAAIKEFAAADVRLDQGDVTDMVLVTGPGTTVQGRLVFEPAEPPGAQVRISAGGADRLSAMTGAVGAMADESTFVIPDVFGPALIRAQVARPQGWILKCVQLRGRDVTDVPTEFSAADEGQVEIVFTSRAARIDGRATDASGAPAAGGNVLLFGEDPATWTIRSSSLLRMVGIEKDGSFSMIGLRPGRYLVVALPRGRSINLFDVGRDVFEPLAAEATPVELAEAERRSINVRTLEAR